MRTKQTGRKTRGTTKRSKRDQDLPPTDVRSEEYINFQLRGTNKKKLDTKIPDLVCNFLLTLDKLPSLIFDLWKSK